MKKMGKTPEKMSGAGHGCSDGAANGRSHFDVYADGSYKSRSMGAGWVVYKDNQKILDRSVPLIATHKGTSTLAEISAAHLALASIPRSASVTLYTDCQTIVDLMNNRHNGPVSIGQDKHKGNTDRAIKALFAAAACHQAVNVVMERDVAGSRLREAHHLAQSGAERAEKIRDRQNRHFQKSAPPNPPGMTG